LSGNAIPRYETLERLGEGAFGTVYKARDLDLDRFVALRIIPARRFSSREDRRRLTRESAVLASLDHPNLCAVYESGETPEGDLFLASAFCEGETLAQRLEHGPLKPAVAVDLAAQVAAGLARAHERGLVHRNLRPSNLFIAPDGRAKIIGFGLPGLGEQTLFSEVRAEPSVPSALSYASPEQLRGEWIDARSDVWSLGAILAEMITGRRPVPLEPFGPLRAPHPEAPEAAEAAEELEKIAARAMAPHPADRYAGAQEMRDDLRALGSAASRTASPAPSDPPSGSPSESPSGSPSERGRLVGPYRVLESLGGGGMGIVYRAEDTRLGRIVALKFLPPDLTRDPVAKARFQQEARTASALDHPNVCTIFEVGETADGQLFIAMPCYDGETLRQRLERGPLPVDEALDVAAQVARGLAKAHRQGIVHRAIKPANLILTGDGVVKILDFGIAKLAGAAVLTRAGSTLGTPAYMSPEQMRGEEVDARTDLWSLGVVLYEMLAGRRPFPGEHASVVRETILGAQPEPLSRRRPEIPPPIERITAGLLAKNPADRFASADQVANELRALAGVTSGSLATAPSMPAMPATLPAAQVAPRGKGWLRWAAAGLALAGLAGAGSVLSLRLIRPAASKRVLPATFTRLTDLEGSETFPSLSPSGELFVYAKAQNGKTDIYLQRVGGGNPLNLTAESPADSTQPAFSPDGAQIAFRSEREGGGIFVMGATGESMRRVTDRGFNPAWSPDGREIAFSTESISDPRVRSTEGQVWRVDIATGRLQRVAGPDAVQPSWSPHGRRIAYWGIPRGSGRRVLWTVPDGGGSPVVVTESGAFNWSPAWSPNGRSLYFASDRGGSMNLWRVPIEEESGKVLGDPQAVTSSSQWSGLLSLSRDGRHLIYATSEESSSLEAVPLDSARLAATGAPAVIFQGPRALILGGGSPDGGSIVLQSMAPQEDLFLIRTDGGGLRQLTRDPAKDRGPVWSPDGRIVFFSDRGGHYEPWSIGPDGGDLRRLVETGGEPLYRPIPSPDGHWLVCGLGYTGLALFDLRLPLERRVALRLPALGMSSQPFFADSWSPDSQSFAGGIEYGGIVIYSLPGRRYESLTDHGALPVWIDSGRLLYVDQGRVYWIDRKTKTSRQLLAPPAGSFFTHADLSPNRRTLYLMRSTPGGDIWMLTSPEESF
jgi:serine/threonine protein kinase/Tol biopolymer transport system component